MSAGTLTRFHTVSLASDGKPRTPARSGIKRMHSWTTQLGKTLSIWEMSDSHLLNCIKYMLRKAPEYYAASAPSTAIHQGHRALPHFSGQGEEHDPRKWGMALIVILGGVFFHLVAEANDRGLELGPSVLMDNRYSHLTPESVKIVLKMWEEANAGKAKGQGTKENCGSGCRSRRRNFNGSFYYEEVEDYDEDEDDCPPF